MRCCSPICAMRSPRRGVDAQRDFQLHVAHLRAGRQGRLQVDVTAGVEVQPEKCDQHHTAQGGGRNSNLFPFHRKRLSLLALAAGAMHSSARFRANSPKGGDAKPPVYGTHVPMTAGLPVWFRTARPFLAPRVADRPKDASPECLGTAQAPHTVLLCLKAAGGGLRKTLHTCLRSGRATFALCDGGGTLHARVRAFRDAIARFRERAHVQFNFALIYSASDIHSGRSFSGVST